MSFVTMTPVNALETVEIATLNAIKTNVDQKADLYHYNYMTTANHSTSSASWALVGANPSLDVTIPTIAEQNLLISFSGVGRVNTSSMYIYVGLYIDTVQITYHLVRYGDRGLNLQWVLPNSVGGENIEIQYLVTADTGTILAGAVLDIKGF